LVLQKLGAADVLDEEDQEVLMSLGFLEFSSVFFLLCTGLFEVRDYTVFPMLRPILWMWRQQFSGSSFRLNVAGT
jgi:hypothetical protein